MSKTLNWYFRRHPILYKIRFKLVSKTSTLEAIEKYCYNDHNSKDNIAPLFFEINNIIFANARDDLSVFEKALKIAIWLKNNVKGGPGLGKSSAVALRNMIDGAGGVCSDFSQIFSNFCLINDIKVKEWGMKSLSTDARISGGHSFNEVYCNEFQKWIMIDTAKSILLYQKNNNIPLSTLEYIDLKKEKKEIIILAIGKNNSFDNQNANNIFLNSNSLPFVIMNYNNKTVDYFLDKLNFFPESITHGLLILLGKGYTFQFPPKKNL